MYQKDFILKMVEMLAELVAGILGLIKKGDFDQAEKSLENAYFDFLKEDAAFFRKVPLDTLTTELLQKHNYSNSHLEILAELFYTEAELSVAKNNKINAVEYYQKAIKLFEFIDSSSNAFSFEKKEKVLEIQDKLNKLL